jgi:hypothetical protein
MMTNARTISLPRQLLLAATLATGFGTTWAALVFWLGNAIERAWPGPDRPRESLVVRSDGTPLIEATPHYDLSRATYRDLDGRAQPAPDRDETVTALYLPGERPRSPGVFASKPGWERRVKVFMDERAPAVNWFFVHDGERRGAGYFVGYERESNRRVGFIGLSGFRPDPPPANERIPVRGELMWDDSHWSSSPFWINTGRWAIRPDRRDIPPRLVHVPSGNDLRLVDLAARTVATVFRSPEPIESVAIPSLSSFSATRPSRDPVILVRTRRRIYQLDSQHRLIGTFTIPAEADRSSWAYWYPLDDGRAIAAFDRRPSAGEALAADVARQWVYRVAEGGTIRDSIELALHSGWRGMSERASIALLALGLPSPALLFAAGAIAWMESDEARFDRRAFVAMLRIAWPPPAAVVVLSTALALIARRRCRAFGLARREQLAWASFVLLLGFPAYVGFLLGRRWPTREPCPNCHARSARDRDACASCGEPFPAPAPRGIEIFA